MNYTHQKRPYKATCLQWDGLNTDAVTAMLEAAGAEVSPYGEQLMLRWRNRNSGLTIEMMDKWDWLRLGENGVLKMMKPDEFSLKYEEVRCVT